MAAESKLSRQPAGIHKLVPLSPLHFLEAKTDLYHDQGPRFAMQATPKR